MSTARMGGIRALKNFILGTWLLWRLKNTFAILYILTTPTAPKKQKFILKRQLRPKMTFKGKKFENSGFPLDFMSMFQMTHKGIHPPIFLIFEIRLVRYLEDPFAKS